MTTGPDGAFSFEVPAGTYRLDVPLDPVVRRERFHQLLYPGDERGLLPPMRWRVAVASVDVRCDLKLPPGAILARAFDATTGARLTNVTFVWRPPLPTVEAMLLEGAAGAARFDDVPAGLHAVSGKLRGYSGGIRKVEVGDTPVTVDLMMLPTGALDLVLVDERRQQLAIRHDLDALLRNIDTGAISRSPVRRVSPGQELATVFECDGVEPGTYEVMFTADRLSTVGRRSVRFGPGQAIEPCTVEVPARRVVRIEVPFQYRSRVALRGVDTNGKMASGGLKVEWLDPIAGTTLVLPAGRSTHPGPYFEGYLVPGTYSLTFTRGERTWRESLTVGRGVLERAFIVPW